MNGESQAARRIAAVRRFNRFYTRRIGVLHEGLLRSPFSLTEARVLYELAHRENATATEIGGDLGIDAGHLSRILAGFAKRGFLGRTRSDRDGRRALLALTAKGRKTFAALDRRSRDEVAAMLAGLPETDRDRLVAAMDAIEGLLDPASGGGAPYVLRPHRPGDMGWIVHRHGALYAQEYGWDERFEGFVAGIAREFLEGHDAKCERCWIAERDGEIVGSVMLVRQSKAIAKLRLLLVEPKARGLGIGARLVDECIDFARRAGYAKIVLWTNSQLHAARRIYQDSGFRRTGRERHRSFGHDLVGETWELTL